MSIESLNRRLKAMGMDALYKDSSTDEDEDYLDQVNKEIANSELRLNAAGVEIPAPEKRTNLLLKAMDILDRPRNAVANAIQDSLDNENDFMTGLLEGLSGKEHVYGSDFIKPTDIKNPFSRAVVGFGIDVAMDPLTYVGAPVVKGIAKTMGRVAGSTIVREGLGALDKHLGVISGGKKLIDKIGPLLDNSYASYGAAENAAQRDAVREMSESAHATFRAIYGEQMAAGMKINEMFKDVPKAAREVVPYSIEAPIQTARRLAKLKPEDLEASVRQSFGADFDKIHSSMSSSIYNDKAVKDIVRNLKRKGEYKLAKKVPTMDPQDLAGMIDQKMHNKLTKYSNRRAMIDMAQSASVVDIKGQQDIMQRALASGASMTDINKAAQLAKDQLMTSGMADLSAGVKFDPVPNYIYHIYDDPQEKIRSVMTEWSIAQAAKRAGLSPKGGFQYRRMIPTLEEAEKMGLHPIKDIAVIAGVREMEGVKVRLLRDMFKTLSKQDTQVVMDAAEHAKLLRAARDAGDAEQAKRLTQWRGIQSAYFPNDKVVHPDIARSIERAMDIYVTTGGAREFMDGFNKVQNMWKSIVTSVVPSFHMRNLSGNFFNNYLAGITNPAYYASALRIMEGSDAPFKIGNTMLNGQELYDDFVRHGLVGFGFFRGESKSGMVEMMEDIMEGMDKPSGLLKAAAKGTPIRHPFKFGRSTGNAIETWSKLAHYIGKRAQGLSPMDAAESVRKYLFDYGDITPFEKAIRTFIPFYTFTRKNIPLQLETLFKNPAKYTRIKHALDEAQQASGIDDTPDWLKEDLAIPIGTDDEGYEKYLRLDLPATQLGMLTNPTDLLGMVSPLVKTPFELVMNKTIGGKEIESYPGARGRYYLPFIPGQKSGEPYQLPATADYAIQQTGGAGREIAELLTRLAGQTSGATGGDASLGRSVADTLFNTSSAPDVATGSKVPPTLRQVPVVGSFFYRSDPRRQLLLEAINRRRQLQEKMRYARDVQGTTIPTVREIEQRGY